jgi:hypothetical protein
VAAEQDLIRELVRLRRGRGLQNRGLRGRIGPQLIRLCGIGDTDDDRDIRERVRAWLDRLGPDLPPDLAHAAEVALALDRAHQHRQLTQRVESLASEQSWAPRTARRRIDEATRQVSQVALRRGDGRPGGVGSGAGTAGTDQDSRTWRPPEPFGEVSPLGTPETRRVVLRLPVPRGEFDLVIKFEATEAAEPA